MAHGKFEFKGTGGDYLWLVIWTSFLTLITLGLYFPWVATAVWKWLARNIYIDGKRLVFKGTGMGFFGTYLLILLLSIVTLGLYLPWGACRMLRWVASNTYFADEGDY